MTNNSIDKCYTYLFTYTHDGADWCFEIQARNPEDARDRVAKLAFARYDGQVVAKLPSYLGPFARLVSWARNLAPGTPL